MSNGEDVLDNWEEIDEAQLTNKLQQIEEERKLRENTRLETFGKFSENFAPSAEKVSETEVAPVLGKMKLLQRPAQASVVTPQQPNNAESVSSPFDSMQSTFQPVLMVLHKDSDEYQSANYTQPINTQTVKILRRPTQSSEPRNNGVRPKQPIKTLQQREQEYAEARLRILGSAKNPEDDQAANAAQSGNPTTTSSSTTTATTSTNTTSTFTSSLGATTNSQAKTNTPNRTQQQQQQQQVQQPHYGGALNPYNVFYQQQSQNMYFQKQPMQQQHHAQQQQPLHHSLSAPAFVGNNRSQFMAPSLLPTPPLLPNAAAVNMQNRHQYPQQQPQTWSPVVGGSVSSYTLQRQQQRQQQIDVLRTPRGPDGSTGFQMRR